MTGAVVDDFAGPGGWDEGVRPLGLVPVGLELDPLACATAEAAGHRRLRVDVAAHDPATLGRVSGHLSSPPCPGFSIAGRGAGRDDSLHLLDALAGVHTRADVDRVIATLRPTMTHDATLLALEPLRRVLALTPSWLAWEQVPTVLPLWDACAAVLRRIGYSVATGVLHAEQYGVPQVRKRAVLVARAPWLTREHGPARLPEPTHSRYHSRNPERLDAGVKPWRSMESAVGWGYTARPSGTVVSQSDGGPRLLDGGSGAWQGVLRAVEAGQWVRRPDRLHLPLNRGEVSTTPIRDGALLQTFPADYPWQGTDTMRAKQVGNAVPPLLARAIVAEVAAIADPLR